MEQGIKEVNVRLTSQKNTYQETVSFTVMVPDSVSRGEIYTELNRCHEELCSESASDECRVIGMNPRAMMNYVCEKNGWKCRYFNFDIDLLLE